MPEVSVFFWSSPELVRGKKMDDGWYLTVTPEDPWDGVLWTGPYKEGVADMEAARLSGRTNVWEGQIRHLRCWTDDAEHVLKRMTGDGLSPHAAWWAQIRAELVDVQDESGARVTFDLVSASSADDVATFIVDVRVEYGGPLVEDPFFKLVYGEGFLSGESELVTPTERLAMVGRESAG